MTYFSEREGDVPVQTQDTPTPDFINATVSLLSGLCERGWLARGWPRRCPDEGHPIIGTDENAFWNEALSTLNLKNRHPANLVNEPEPLRILNLVEFTHRHVAQPINQGFHSHFTHYHLDFNGPQGKQEFAADVNALFVRFGLAFRLEPNGQVVRLAPPVLQDIIGVAFFTGDAALDGLLEDAVKRFKDPSPKVRRESLEKLWDAFERLKTIEPPNQKPKSADVLLDKASGKPEIKAVLEAEFKALSDIGNKFMIRHTETTKIPVDVGVDVDYFFHRMFAALWRVLKATGRC